jgi:hypothetical protein
LLDFRAELFNALNQTQLGPANNSAERGYIVFAPMIAT